MELETFLTTDELAAITRTTPTTIRRAAKAGTLRAIKFGKQWLFRRDILDTLESNDLAKKQAAERPGTIFS